MTDELDDRAVVPARRSRGGEIGVADMAALAYDGLNEPQCSLGLGVG